MNLILASASPRRSELLREAGFEFDVMPAGIDEESLDGEPPGDYARRNAAAKARAVAGRTTAPAIVLGADTIVVCRGRILEKPAEEREAASMLDLLRGREHEVISGVALVDTRDGSESIWEVRTRVTFRKISDEDIHRYVATGEPMDKAGAYAIQGGAAHMVRGVQGSYTNVVGLPLAEVVEALAGKGIGPTGGTLSSPR